MTEEVSEATINKFWSKVQKSEDCWIWKSSKSQTNGYGIFVIRIEFVVAHRFAYELQKGKIPDGLQLDHLCCNKSCVNPDHLEPVTRSENVKRASHMKLKIPMAIRICSRCNKPQVYDRKKAQWYQTSDPSTILCRRCHKKDENLAYRIKQKRLRTMLSWLENP